MPNWVYNTVNIHGEPERIKGFLAVLGDTKIEDNGEVNFLNLIAPPDEHLEEYLTVGRGPHSIGLSSEDKSAHPVYNWYDWNYRNWGTKWNACLGGVEVDEDGTHAAIYFETAWSPPDPIMDAIARLAKHTFGLEIGYRWQEEQGFGAEYEVNAMAEFELVDEWDIPETHEEQMERNGYCWCLETDDKPFDDCPTAAVKS